MHLKTKTAQIIVFSSGDVYFNIDNASRDFVENIHTYLYQPRIPLS